MGRGSECRCERCSKRSWGAWAGDVARDLGVRAQVRACWSTVGRGEGRAELTGGSHGAARGNGRGGKRFSALTKRAREAERERSARARATGADRVAPLGRGRGGEGTG
jgi:hypothetical protein